ncbi:zinc finger protein 830-like [Montipora foliosa]|uniref:zinc finger protein 830-like n=1 Tax=Montipora foliosa TaxID=591990 RepID=UPI0035F1A10B
MASARDLRLVKNQRESKKKIASPLAKYNSAGQLYCVLCNIPIKSAILWDSHVLGKKHKENLAVFKAKSSRSHIVPDEIQSSKVPKKIASLPRNEPTFVQPVSKRASDDKCATEDCVPSKKFKANLSGQKNSVEESEIEIDVDSRSCSAKDVKSDLPSDFFDTPQQSKDTAQNEQLNDNEDSTEGIIPEGFFDDPKLDAKARKVEYKDAAEEEWENFQKAMQVESQVSQSIVEGEDEESRVDREFSELSEQRLYFLRADALRDKQSTVKEIVSKKKAQARKLQEENPASNSDDSDYEELFDWRAKKVFDHSH